MEYKAWFFVFVYCFGMTLTFMWSICKTSINIMLDLVSALLEVVTVLSSDLFEEMPNFENKQKMREVMDWFKYD